MSGEDDIAKAIKKAAPLEPEPPNDRDLAELPRNDYGNGQRLKARYGADMIFVDAAGWHLWDGWRWEASPDKRAPEAQKRAHLTVLAIPKEADSFQPELQALHEDLKILKAELVGLDPGSQQAFELRRQVDSVVLSIETLEERIAAHRKFAILSGNSGKFTAMLCEVAPYLRRRPGELDGDPFLFNVMNGTLRLGPKPRSGSDEGVRIELLKHDRRDLITHLSPVEYDPEAEAPRFRAFLEKVQPDPASRAFLQRLIGYVITGDTGEQIMAMFHGKGANGKTTFISVIASALGDYALTLPIQTFLQDDRRSGGEATPDLARLPGARLVTASEPERSARLSESVVKTVTGGDKVVARRLFEGQFEFDPVFKLILLVNEKPRIGGQDEGMWRRVLLVPWDVFIPKEERNSRIKEELLVERPGILNWILDGYRLWREQGLAVPEAVRMATDQYRAESDPIGQFLQVCTQPSQRVELQARVLYDVYCAWARANAMDPMSTTYFGRRLSDLGVAKRMVQVVYYGLEFTVEGSRLYEQLQAKKSGHAGDPPPSEDPHAS